MKIAVKIIGALGPPDLCTTQRQFGRTSRDCVRHVVTSVVEEGI